MVPTSVSSHSASFTVLLYHILLPVGNNFSIHTQDVLPSPPSRLRREQPVTWSEAVRPPPNLPPIQARFMPKLHFIAIQDFSAINTRIYNTAHQSQATHYLIFPCQKQHVFSLRHDDFLILIVLPVAHHTIPGDGRGTCHTGLVPSLPLEDAASPAPFTVSSASLTDEVKSCSTILTSC